MDLSLILPDVKDNAAVTVRDIRAGETLEVAGDSITVTAPVLTGHRIAVKPIQQGELITSWGIPFGEATAAIAPGEYLCNERMQSVLQHREPELFPKPPTINFADRDTVSDPESAGEQAIRHNSADLAHALTFPGFNRGEARGWGTRNYIAVIGASSLSTQLVIDAVHELRAQHPESPETGFDGIVAVTHTEGGTGRRENNHQLVIRTLAGFAVNPNVGAAIIVNHPESSIENAEVLEALNNLPLPSTSYTVRYFTATGNLSEDIDGVVATANSVVSRVKRSERENAPISALRLAMQCGGSDAFSGVSANPVLGEASDLIVRSGGSVNIAETDELIGSESHTLDTVSSAAAAQKFLAVQKRFKEWAGRHGHSAEGNPSGGNLYRGLYNITLKSIGAARKKSSKTVLDHVIDYGQLMTTPGFYFMDSPGNDLESIAGQVASGANVIAFTTGNGSITNFPFVPTVKIVTTTQRYEMLETEMDFNAGTILEGADLEAVGAELFDQIVAAASGTATSGEATGQSQVQIWRAWGLEEGESSAESAFEPTGIPAVPISPEDAFTNGNPPWLNLILPTSLCSGQVAEKLALTYNEGNSLHRVVALPHTEGCGVTSGESETVFARILLGYAQHPSIRSTVFLEHGCEKTHNDFFRQAMSNSGLDINSVGWASIQLGGGIQGVQSSIKALFEGAQSPDSTPHALTIGIVNLAAADQAGAELSAKTVSELVSRGISVIIPENVCTVTTEAGRQKLKELHGDIDLQPTLKFGERPTSPGLHIMQTESTDSLEIFTGLGASGCSAIVNFAGKYPHQPHRFIPTLQVGQTEGTCDLGYGPDLTAASVADTAQLTAQGLYAPVIGARPNVGFQIPRGQLGISM